MTKKALTEPKISVVLMKDIPAPSAGQGRRNKWLGTYHQLVALPADKTLRLECANSAQALAIRSALRKLAQKDGRMLSSSGGGATRYLWLEPKGTKV